MGDQPCARGHWWQYTAATGCGHWEVIQVLLGKGKVDVNYKNKFGDALLFGLWL